ncbi:hypothetical protein HUU39_23465 [candidate division KSB1 bacterium]|nr:hypothetical protein [bacterium]NUM68192.1 hypothetical protein [candidate division KSB1 bacterium]
MFLVKAAASRRHLFHQIAARQLYRNQIVQRENAKHAKLNIGSVFIFALLANKRE